MKSRKFESHRVREKRKEMEKLKLKWVRSVGCIRFKTPQGKDEGERESWTVREGRVCVL